MAIAQALALGPWSGVYRPGYDVRIYSNGDPSKPLTGVNLRTCTRVWTSKSIDDVSGQFQVTLKDRRAQSKVQPMDVVTIRLQGHNQGWGKVLVGVVDEVEPTGTAGVSSAQADVTISGRCTGKYLQSNSMFLPVWDPLANLPTALIFGMGDSSNKLGTGVNAYLPRTIFGYIFDHFVVGLRNRVGLSGTPNARYWMNRSNRFEFVKNAAGTLFQVPFVQFDEDTCDTALTQLVVQGFTEGWVDEVGNVVYRPPQWDAPISWTLHTGGLKDWDLPSSDVAMATYVEVYPGALPALPSGTAQAMLAGRAPIPSDYVTGLQSSGFTGVAAPEFIIDTDSTGKVTSKGAQNWYYQKQKKYGLRPYQITSPLLADRQQAQAQAEGLLRFMLRYDKSGTFDIPGEPNVKLGQTILLHGRLEDQAIYRTYYVGATSHEYVEGDHYTTSLTLTHGRDPGDPSWQQMVLPNFSAAALAQASGILSPAPAPSTGGKASGSSYVLPANVSGVRAAVVAAGYSALVYKSGYSAARPIPNSLAACQNTPTDCSGFVTLCAKAGGAPDPNGTNYNPSSVSSFIEQANCVQVSSPQPGDLAIWPDHVALCVGNGQIISWGSKPGPILETIAAENGVQKTLAGHGPLNGYFSFIT